jgi:hypothetical protein
MLPVDGADFKQEILNNKNKKPGTIYRPGRGR